MMASTILTLLLLTAGGVAGAQSLVPQAVVLPEAIRGAAYEARLGSPFGSRCPLSDASWRIAGGDPPQGITADVNGVRGIPQQTGTYHFLLEAANNCSTLVVPIQLTVRMRPILSVSAESMEIQVSAGSGGLSRSFLVSSDWAELPFSVGSDHPSWLSAEQQSGATPAANAALSAVPVHIGINPQDLKPGVYSAKLRVSAWSAANSPTVEVKLVVQPAVTQ